MGSSAIVLVVMGILVVYLMTTIVILNRIVKCGPNEVFVISGRCHIAQRPDGSRFRVGFRTLKGGRTFIWPFIERVDRLSLEVITHEMKAERVFTSDAVSNSVDCVIQLKIKGDAVSIAEAVQHFLSKTEKEIGTIASNVIESHLRTALAGMTSDQASHDRGIWPDTIRQAASDDLARMGIEIISLTVRDIKES